jgi:hypothetical protein
VKALNNIMIENNNDKNRKVLNIQKYSTLCKTVQI